MIQSFSYISQFDCNINPLIKQMHWQGLINWILLDLLSYWSRHIRSSTRKFRDFFL